MSSAPSSAAPTRPPLPAESHLPRAEYRGEDRPPEQDGRATRGRGQSLTRTRPPSRGQPSPSRRPVTSTAETPEGVAVIESALQEMREHVETFIARHIKANFRPPASRPSRHTLEDILEEFIKAPDWEAEMKALVEIEAALGRHEPSGGGAWTRGMCSHLIEKFVAVISSPRSQVSRKGLLVITQLLFVSGEKLRYTNMNVSSLPITFLKRAQEHIHPAFITQSAKLAITLWLVKSSVDACINAFDQIFNMRKVPSLSLALLSVVIFMSKLPHKAIDLWPIMKSTVYGLKTIADSGRKTDRMTAELVLFLILIVGQTDTPTHRQPRPRTQLPPSVSDLSGNPRAVIDQLQACVVEATTIKPAINGR